MPNEETKNKIVGVVAPLFISKLQMTADQVKRIEHETKAQHKSYLWRQHRVGRITASNFHQVYMKTESIIKNRSKSSKSKPQ